jgi:hypothetical protein
MTTVLTGDGEKERKGHDGTSPMRCPRPWSSGHSRAGEKEDEEVSHFLPKYACGKVCSH